MWEPYRGWKKLGATAERSPTERIRSCSSRLIDTSVTATGCWKSAPVNFREAVTSAAFSESRTSPSGSWGRASRRADIRARITGAKVVRSPLRVNSYL